MSQVFREALRPLFSRVAKAIVEVTLTNDDGNGTGIVLSKDGYVLTAAHVVEGGVPLRLTRYRLHDKKWRLVKRKVRRLTADVIASDRKTDLALLKIRNPPRDLVPAQLGQSWKICANVPAFHLGMNDVFKFGAGHVIGIGAEDGVPELNVSISHGSGSSGGPVFDADGKVFGILLRGDDDEFLPPIARVLPIDVAKSGILWDWLTKNRQ